MTLPDNDLAQLQKRLRTVEDEIARLSKPEIGKQLILADHLKQSTAVNYPSDNNAHTFITKTLAIPAGAIVWAELHHDFDIRHNAAGVTGHTLRLRFNVAPDWGQQYCSKFPSGLVQNSTSRQDLTQCLIGRFDTDTSLTIYGEMQNWDYTISYLHLWSTWTRLFWRVYV